MREVTRWSLPKVLLEYIPESAPELAALAVDAYDISDEVPIPPAAQAPLGRRLNGVPSEPKPLIEVASEWARDEASQVADEFLARNMQVELSPYTVISCAFVHPVLEPALDTAVPNEDLLRRCAAFIAAALTAADSYVAEAASIRVVERFLTPVGIRRIGQYLSSDLRESLEDEGPDAEPPATPTASSMMFCSGTPRPDHRARRDADHPRLGLDRPTRFWCSQPTDRDCHDLLIGRRARSAA